MSDPDADTLVVPGATDRFREHARESATTHLDHPDGEVLTGLLDRLVYVGGTTAGGTRSTGWRSMPTGPRRCRCGSSGTARA